MNYFPMTEFYPETILIWGTLVLLAIWALASLFREGE